MQCQLDKYLYLNYNKENINDNICEEWRYNYVQINEGKYNRQWKTL